MPDQYAHFGIPLDPENVWKGHVTPNKVNLVRNYPTAGGRKGHVVVQISDKDYLWHAHVPGNRPIEGSYDDVTTFLASEGIDAPEKEKIIKNIYGLASRAQFVNQVLSGLKKMA